MLLFCKKGISPDWKEVLNKTAQLMIELGEGKAISLTDFSRIKQLVVIGLGEFDNMVSKEEPTIVSNLLQNGKLELFKNFKHPIEQTDAKVLADRILFYFGKLK